MSEQLTVAAKPGDVWAFSIEGEESIVGFAVVADVWGHIEFRTVLGNALKLPTSVYTDARKIWPPEEPEWEYGTESRFEESDEVYEALEWGSREQAEGVARDFNSKEIAEDRDVCLCYSVVKRIPAVPAGPWVPVKQEGTTE